MKFARTAYQWVAWISVATLPVLFLLAGLGTLGGESIEPHKALASLVEVEVVVLFVLAIAGGMGRTAIVRNVILVALVFLEASLGSSDLNPRWLRSFHVVGAMAVGLALSEAARRAGMPWRQRAPGPMSTPSISGDSGPALTPESGLRTTSPTR